MVKVASLIPKLQSRVSGAKKTEAAAATSKDKKKGKKK